MKEVKFKLLLSVKLYLWLLLYWANGTRDFVQVRFPGFKRSLSQAYSFYVRYAQDTQKPQDTRKPAGLQLTQEASYQEVSQQYLEGRLRQQTSQKNICKHYMNVHRLLLRGRRCSSRWWRVCRPVMSYAPAFWPFDWHFVWRIRIHWLIPVKWRTLLMTAVSCRRLCVSHRHVRDKRNKDFTASRRKQFFRKNRLQEVQ